MPEPNTGCWLWMGSLCDGYGNFIFRGHNRAHRASFEIHKGEIPKGMLVCHTCDQRSCVNPDHLFLGTIQDNMDDRNRKGRQAMGERNHSKIDSATVIKMRTLYVVNGMSTRKIAKIFSLSSSVTHKIVTGQKWKHLPF